MDLLTFYSMAENTLKSIPSVVDENGYSYVWAVVITGLSVVFLGLIILILFVWLMGKAFTAIQKIKVCMGYGRTSERYNTVLITKNSQKGLVLYE